MAHFAKLNDQNIVEAVHVVSNDVAINEQTGVDFLKSLHGENTNWKQTSYNTRLNIHNYGGIAFRKNYAGIGFKYDEQKDAFISPKPYESWILDEISCTWKAPITKPDEINLYIWNETTQTWDLQNI